MRSTTFCQLKKHYGGQNVGTYHYQSFKKSYNISKKPKRTKFDSLINRICISTIIGYCCRQGVLLPDRLLEMCWYFMLMLDWMIVLKMWLKSLMGHIWLRKFQNDKKAIIRKNNCFLVLRIPSYWSVCASL